jgi:hypothetical protein
MGPPPIREGLRSSALSPALQPSLPATRGLRSLPRTEGSIPQRKVPPVALRLTLGASASAVPVSRSRGPDTASRPKGSKAIGRIWALPTAVVLLALARGRGGGVAGTGRDPGRGHTRGDRVRLPALRDTARAVLASRPTACHDPFRPRRPRGSLSIPIGRGRLDAAGNLVRYAARPSEPSRQVREWSCRFLCNRHR